MPFKVSMRVEGLREILDALENVTRQDFVQTRINICQEAMKVFEEEADSKVHVITGKTQNSIRVLPAAKDGSSIIIQAEHGAYFEEKRGEEHAFMSMGKQKMDEQINEIVVRNMENMWRKNRGVTPLGSRFF